MREYDYKTDSESGEVEAESLQAALDQVRPTDAEIADGAFAWVEDQTTGERLQVGSTH